VAQFIRWGKLVLVAAAIGVGAYLLIALWIAPGHPGSYDRAGTVENLAPYLILVLIAVVIGLALYAIAKHAVKHGIQEAQQTVPPNERSPHPPGFPVVTRESESAAPADGPGQYRIQGVHRQSKMDISKYIQADCAANAKIKAELDDIVVSSVTKAPL
jgi:hypothetical protein